MFEIKKIKLDLLVLLNMLEMASSSEEKNKVIEQIKSLRILLNGLEAQLTHFSEINMNMNM